MVPKNQRGALDLNVFDLAKGIAYLVLGCLQWALLAIFGDIKTAVIQTQKTVVELQIEQAKTSTKVGEVYLRLDRAGLK